MRYNDLDPLGHVNNSLFFTYLEIARAGLIEDALGPGSWSSCILARVELDFRAEIPISCREVTVRCQVLRLGTSSIRTLDEIVLPDGTVAVTWLALAVTEASVATGVLPPFSSVTTGVPLSVGNVPVSVTCPPGATAAEKPPVIWYCAVVPVPTATEVVAKTWFGEAPIVTLSP